MPRNRNRRESFRNAICSDCINETGSPKKANKVAVHPKCMAQATRCSLNGSELNTSAVKARRINTVQKSQIITASTIYGNMVLQEERDIDRTVANLRKHIVVNQK